MFQQNISLLVAFGAGVISFVSPCILPVIPSFLSFIGGVSVADMSTGKAFRGRLFLRTLFFVTGFSLVFVALGLIFSGTGFFLSSVQSLVSRIAGAVVVLFGLNVLFDFWKGLDVERRLHVRRKPHGALGSLLVGVAFGAGWTPCVGPILASILFLAGTSGSAARGAGLLIAYSLGLGTPFLLAGVFFNSFQKHSQIIRRNAPIIRILSGTLMILLGALIFFGNLSRLNAAFFNMAAGLQKWGQDSPMGPRLLFGLLFLGFGAAVGAFGARRAIRAIKHNDRSLPAVLRPVALPLLIVLLTASALSFVGVIDFGALISSWLRFQGL